jgi:hypothetical protein
VAMRILTIESLSKITNTTEYVDSTRGRIEISSYFDNRYGNMSPLFCFVIETDNGESNDVCLIKIDNAYALPIMNHYGDYADDGVWESNKCDW